MARCSPAGSITERDREILRWVGQGGVATLDQLARRFWPGRREETAQGRLRQLARAGYLSMHAGATGLVARGDAMQLFTLTRMGTLLFSPLERELFYVGLPSPAEIHQQVLAQEAYLKLEAEADGRGARIVGWKSERVLRRELLRGHARKRQGAYPSLPLDIPDAELTLLTSSGESHILYLEVDGAYYGKMLWQKAVRLGSARYPVTWACTKARAERVRALVSMYPNIRVLEI